MRNGGAQQAKESREFASRKKSGEGEYIHIHIIEEDDYNSDEVEYLSEGIKKEGIEVES